jgi:HlyD family secretion protein
VFVVTEAGTVEQRAVELGITGITQQAIERGIEAGETVVTQGQNRLVEGTPVRVVDNPG